MMWSKSVVFNLLKVWTWLIWSAWRVD